MTGPVATAGTALAAGIARLRAAGVPEPARDARRLLAHALGVAPGRVTLLLPEPLDAAAADRFETALAARARRQPVSQIVGVRDFLNHSFQVSPAVLDPRPETEILVSLALERPFTRVLDLGTGSGCILLSLLAARPATTGLGVDISAAALAVAGENAVRLGLTGRAELALSDWFAQVQGRFDLIVANPPYIAASEMPDLAPELRDWEPPVALTDGADGLGAYRAIAAGAGAHLAPEGRMMVEIGPAQGAAVAALFTQAGLENVTIHPDLDGRDRVVCGEAASTES